MVALAQPGKAPLELAGELNIEARFWKLDRLGQDILTKSCSYRPKYH
jgi:hypothetical protein